jgi:hypothetical protein
MQGDFDKMQGGGKRNPAKNRQIAAAWMELSLLQEQGGYAAVAGKRWKYDRQARHTDLLVGRDEYERDMNRGHAH